MLLFGEMRLSSSLMERKSRLHAGCAASLWDFSMKMPVSSVSFISVIISLTVRCLHGQPPTPFHADNHAASEVPFDLSQRKGN